ncbi:glycine oxidase ThiO [Marinimicrobium locisalis]|uniref:glycine oxidase ThiO n=1 Tax=Marinimicrobium locisalis TaxID=546022 RepID=UPI003221D761
MGNETESIGIAGAGLLGRLLAWQLLLRGHRVSLFDAGTRAGVDSAAWTAAGMVAPLSEAVVSERPVYDMGLFALAQWPLWVNQLESEHTLWHQQGSLVVSHPQDEAELSQFHRELQYVTETADGYQWVTRPELHDLEPDLSDRFQRGLLLEAEGFLNNRELLSQLLTTIERLGGDCHFECPVNVDEGILYSAGQQYRFDRVIDCRGVGAKPQQPAVRGVRGEVLHVHTREIVLHRPVRLMHPRYQLYIVPKPDHRFVIGATQIESEDRSPMSLQSSLELGSALYTLSPAFAEARILEQPVNLRPTYLDNNPHIETTEGLITVNGLFRHGYLLAPAVVKQVLAEIAGEEDTPFARFLQRPIPNASQGAGHLSSEPLSQEPLSKEPAHD